jgi:adenylosuccinate synthase
MLRILEDVGSRKSWRDGKKQRVEECIDSFIRGIVTAAESKVLRREERERQEKEWQEQQRRREEARRNEEREERRLKQLVQVREWIKWANRVADAMDPIKKDVPDLSEYGKKIDSWKNW